jgi:hypothetical protein
MRLEDSACRSLLRAVPDSLPGSDELGAPSFVVTIWNNDTIIKTLYFLHSGAWGGVVVKALRY